MVPVAVNRPPAVKEPLVEIFSEKGKTMYATGDFTYHFRYKTKKGIVYRCDEKFDPNHNCPCTILVYDDLTYDFNLPHNHESIPGTAGRHQIRVGFLIMIL